ncbi:PREDICTED: uncharacterized protein LOC106148899 [Chinchilla lanigera]|uniref:uncharacterized protein LOC106148899 n=1 Tax=Chinchilla lanigera TaxID=34839 RepID=UPI000697D4B2|nr:PREDICTED: uncharacterized protein LOC106148899 [Chinchilla lanigera]
MEVWAPRVRLCLPRAFHSLCCLLRASSSLSGIIQVFQPGVALGPVEIFAQWLLLRTPGCLRLQLTPERPWRREDRVSDPLNTGRLRYQLPFPPCPAACSCCHRPRSSVHTATDCTLQDNAGRNGVSEVPNSKGTRVLAVVEASRDTCCWSCGKVCERSLVLLSEHLSYVLEESPLNYSVTSHQTLFMAFAFSAGEVLAGAVPWRTMC